MQIIDLHLPGLKLIKPKVFRDSRGFFFESFREPLYADFGMEAVFVQDNHSYSQKNTIRGMHFQTFPGQTKLVRVGIGKIFDVVVDIRPESPTYKQWEGVILDDQDHHQLYIPKGFAHGFAVLSPEAHVFYKVSSIYQPATEKGFRWDDPQIAIQWPISNPIVSERDQVAPYFCDLTATLEEKR